MFSGEAPFQRFSDQRLISALIQGERPPRPFHALSSSRGLNDDMWHLIEACWNQDPGKRPVAAQIIECLCLLPYCAIDTRPLDSHITPAPQMWYKQDKHPFCALAPGPEDTDILKGLKQILADRISGPAHPWEMGASYFLFGVIDVSPDPKYPR
jgi:hypothetical protein